MMKINTNVKALQTKKILWYESTSPGIAGSLQRRTAQERCPYKNKEINTNKKGGMIFIIPPFCISVI